MPLKKIKDLTEEEQNADEYKGLSRFNRVKVILGDTEYELYPLTFEDLSKVKNTFIKFIQEVIGNFSDKTNKEEATRTKLKTINQIWMF